MTENDNPGYTFTTNAGLPTLQKGLSAGKYTIYFVISGPAVQDYDWHALIHTATIYIHDPSETASLAIVHDEGEYTYFSDMKSQISHYDDANPDSRVDRIHLFDNSDTTFSLGVEMPFSVPVTVTEADAKRGYIILDTDYTKLLSTQKHPQDACQSIIDQLAANGESALHTDTQCVSPDRYTSKKNQSTFTKQDISTPYNVTITINSFTKN